MNVVFGRRFGPATARLLRVPVGDGVQGLSSRETARAMVMDAVSRLDRIGTSVRRSIPSAGRIVHRIANASSLAGVDPGRRDLFVRGRGNLFHSADRGENEDRRPAVKPVSTLKPKIRP